MLGQPPGQRAACRPIQNGRQIDESALHRDVRRIHDPALIRAIDGEVTQEVRVDPVRLVPPAGVGLAVERFNALRRGLLIALCSCWSATSVAY